MPSEVCPSPGAWNEGVDGADLGHDDCSQDRSDAGNGGQEGVLFGDIFFYLGFIGDDLLFEQIDFLDRHADGHFGGHISARCRERRACCCHDLFDAFETKATMAHFADALG